MSVFTGLLVGFSSFKSYISPFFFISPGKTSTVADVVMRGNLLSVFSHGFLKHDNPQKAKCDVCVYIYIHIYIVSIHNYIYIDSTYSPNFCISINIYV